MFYLDSLIGEEYVCNYCSWMLIAFLMFNLCHAFSNNKTFGTGYFVLFLVMLLYCVFYSPETGDNYSSMINYYSYLNGTDESRLHFESIYFRIMDLIPFGYVFYRIAVWGAACILGVFLMKRLNIDSHLATLAMLTYALPNLLYYQRASFGYLLLYFAAALYFSKGGILCDGTILEKMYLPLTLILLLCAIPFHTAMPVYVVFVLIAMFVPRNTTTFVVIVIATIIVSSQIKTFSLFALDYLSEDTIETGKRTLEGDADLIQWNTNGKIAQVLYWFPIWSMLIYMLYKMLSNPTVLSEYEKFCLINAFLLFIIALLFVNSSQIIYDKFNKVAMLPWTLFIASYFGRFKEQIECRLFAIGTICTFFI